MRLVKAKCVCCAGETAADRHVWNTDHQRGQQHCKGNEPATLPPTTQLVLCRAQPATLHHKWCDTMKCDSIHRHKCDGRPHTTWQTKTKGT